MKRNSLLALLCLLLLPFMANAQDPYARYTVPGTTDPPCVVVGQLYNNTSTGKLRKCAVVGNPGTWADVGGTTVTPGGSDTQLQRNNAGAFGGISGATSDGTNITFGSGNLRATSPRVTTSLDDSNGNELFKFTATASAVNEITVANAATGNSPVISATGGGTDIGITLTPKGTGNITLTTGGLIFGANLKLKYGTSYVGTDSLLVRNAADSGYSDVVSSRSFAENVIISGFGSNVAAFYAYYADGIYRGRSGDQFGFSSSATDAITAADTGIGRADVAIVKATNGSSGYGAFDASAYKISGVTVYAGGTPSISGNGTLDTGSKDSAGKISINNTGASTVTLTFSITFTRAPACMVNNETTANLARATSTTTQAVFAGTTITGDKLSYICLGY